LLCEMGLDPGLDHMSAAAMIARVHSQGGHVEGFSSVCGGLPAPECAYRLNPFGYKFSWSPIGVLAATRNAAQWRRDGDVIQVSGDALLKSAVPLTGGLLGRTFSLEVLPNRDALPYQALYGIEGSESFFRGTLRYQGWSSLMDGLASLGLTAPTPIPAGVDTWPQLLAFLGMPRGHGSTEAVPRAIEALEWLGASDDTQMVVGATAVDAFCSLLQARLGYMPGERDAVLMEHTLHVRYSDGRRAQTLSASLVDFGDAEGGSSAMSRSVGLTAAVGVHRVVAPPSDRLPPLSGVVKPTEESVWEYCLPRLESEGLRFQESIG